MYYTLETIERRDCTHENKPAGSYRDRGFHITDVKEFVPAYVYHSIMT